MDQVVYIFFHATNRRSRVITH